jgi:predicted NBD/HSP70 family sugar kinase
VTRAGFLGWQDEVRLGDAVAAATDHPVVVDNDLLSVTRAEQWFGAGRKTDHFAVLTVGAGVGYGLVVHDRIVTSPDAGLGLVGDIPLDPFGPRCPAGHRGCGSATLTTDAVGRQVFQALGRTVPWEETLELAHDGHPAVTAIVNDAGRALGRLIAAVANIAMPELVVVAGEGVGLADVASDAVNAGVREARDSRAAPVQLEVRHHDFHSWARGAAVAAIEDYLEHRLTASPDPSSTASSA